MKFRIVRAAKASEVPSQKRIYRLCASQTLSRMARVREAIDLSKLFEISNLPDLPQKKRAHPLWTAIRTFFLAVAARITALFRRSVIRLREKLSRRIARARIRAEKRKKNRPRTSLPILFGALCASFAVALLSAATVLLSLFGGYGGLYRVATVPSFVGLPYEESQAESDDRFSFVVDYRYNPNVTPGYVIAQSPPAGVTRRIRHTGAPCMITLTVSSAAPSYVLDDLVGLSRRDALLVLSNHALRYELCEAYSDSVPVGTVLAQSVPAGTALAPHDTVSLTVSIGPLRVISSVPSLVGLSEMQAISRLLSAGLAVGDVTYVPSDRPAGTVLSQSANASSYLEQGSAVSFSVSAGYSYAPKGIPSLYGLSLAEAEQRLREYGLVLGTVTATTGDASHGTVVAQSPLPDTPIVAGTVSVDITLDS